MKTLVRIALLMSLSATLTPARAESFNPLCATRRITFIDFPVRFFHILKKLNRASSASNETPLDWMERRFSKDLDEPCLWNDFIFLDQSIYFEKSDAITSDAVGLLRLRDLAFDRWITSVHPGLPVRGFGKKFKLFASVGKLIRRPGRYLRHPEKYPEKSAIEKTLQPTTPFSSIFSQDALATASDPQTRQTLSCLRGWLDRLSCDRNFYEVALECAQNDRSAVLRALGVFASQRFYLARDFSSESFRKDRASFTDGASIYFKMETHAKLCGLGSLLPSSESSATADLQTTKAYHFYSTAYLAWRLKDQNINLRRAKDDVLALEGKYKNYIRFFGIFYNVLLDNPPLSGTSGDAHDTRLLENLGFDFGVATP